MWSSKSVGRCWSMKKDRDRKKIMQRGKEYYCRGEKKKDRGQSNDSEGKVQGGTAIDERHRQIKSGGVEDEELQRR